MPVSHSTPLAPALSSSSDTGSSNGDQITNASSLIIEGAGDVGDTIHLYRSATGLPQGNTLIGTATVDSNHHWSVVDTVPADGTWYYCATEEGPLLAVSALSANLLVTYDGIAPLAPSTPQLSADSDSGFSNSDGITSIATPLITGTAEADSTVTLYDTDGTTVLGTTIASNGNWSITTSNLSEGVHHLTAKATDLAGNVSNASSNLTVTILTKLLSVLLPADGSAQMGHLDFIVNFNNSVTVDTSGGNPRIPLTLNGVGTFYAYYLSGSSTNTLIFRETVQSGQQNLNGITVGPLSLNGAIIVDAAGNSADLDGPLEVQSGHSNNGLVISSGVTLYVDSGGLAPNLTVMGQVFNYGTVSTAEVKSSGTLLVGSLGLASDVTVRAGGTVDANAGTVSGSTIWGQGQAEWGGHFDHTDLYGLLRLLYGSSIADNTIIHAGGSEQVQPTSIDNNAHIYGTLSVFNNGTANNPVIENGGVLDIQDGGIASGNITFAGNAATLRIGALISGIAPQFAGVLTNIVSGDVIDLTGLAFAQGGSTSVSGSILTVSNSHGSESFALANAQTTTFSLSADGTGGTLITALVQPAPAPAPAPTPAQASAPAPVIPSSGTTTSAGLVNLLQNQANPAIFTSSTIDQILALTTAHNNTVQFDTTNGVSSVLTSPSVLFVEPTITSPLTISNAAPVVIFRGNGGINVTLNNAVAVPSSVSGSIDRVVVGNADNEHIQINDSINTEVILGGGNNTVVGNGNNSIVQLSGNASNYSVTSSNGHAVVVNNTTQSITDISKIQYVQLDNGNSLVFAKDSVQAAVTALYDTAFGRTADHSGLQYWFDLAAAGTPLKQIAAAFINTPEFAAETALSNSQFVQSLYQHTFGRAGEDAGVAYWTDALSHGATRADLIASFASVAANNIAANTHTEAQVIGNITIVNGIV